MAATQSHIKIVTQSMLCLIASGLARVSLIQINGFNVRKMVLDLESLDATIVQFDPDFR
jgi:hypothetical protein